MRMIITADWHIRATRPRCRQDNDWIGTQKNALEQIVGISKSRNAPVFVVGDLFHSNSDTSFECIQMVQNMSNELQELYVLAGNHDLPYHNSDNLKKSAIGVLLGSLNVALIKGWDGFKGVVSSASNFDEPDNPNAEIVFKHILTFPDKGSIPPNVNATTADGLLELFPKARWIFTGDYHKHFHYENGGRHVVNPGCLLRQASDFKDYQCGVYFVDTKKEVCEFIPLEDDEELVSDDYIIKESERSERITAFVDRLKETKGVSLDFVENVKKALIQNNADEELKDMVNEMIGGSL